MNDIEMQVKIGGRGAIQYDQIIPLILRAWFQNHIVLMSSVGKSCFPLESNYPLLVRIHGYEVFQHLNMCHLFLLSIPDKSRKSGSHCQNFQGSHVSRVLIHDVKCATTP